VVAELRHYPAIDAYLESLEQERANAEVEAA
jgi:hypothetical protein